MSEGGLEPQDRPKLAVARLDANPDPDYWASEGNDRESLDPSAHGSCDPLIMEGVSKM